MTDSVLIYAVADVHLGMKFSAYDEAQEALVEGRFATLTTCVAEANAREAELFVVAGDLFDRVRVARPVIERAAAILAAFEGAAVLVLPGNHDYHREGLDSLWTAFRDAAGDRTVLLREPRVYDLSSYDVPVDVYAAPCDSKHSTENRLGWVEGPTSGRLSLGIAHGSVEGRTLDSEGHYFPMTAAEIAAGGLDLWIIGHTHRQFYDGATGYLIPGTPEPDGFDCPHDGSAAFVRLSPGGEPIVEEVSTGRYRFIERSVSLDPATDLESQLVPAEAASSSTVARLIVSGLLPAEAYQEYLSLRGTLAERFLSLDLRDSEVRRALDSDDIDSLYPEESFPHRLLTELLAADDPAGLDEARTLLQEAQS